MKLKSFKKILLSLVLIGGSIISSLSFATNIKTNNQKHFYQKKQQLNKQYDQNTNVPIQKYTNNDSLQKNFINKIKDHSFKNEKFLVKNTKIYKYTPDSNHLDFDVDSGHVAFANEGLDYGDGFDFKFGLFVNNNLIGTQIWTEEIRGRSTKNVPLNFYAKNIKKTDDVELKIINVISDDENKDMNLSLTLISNYKMHEFINTLNKNVETFNVDSITSNIIFQYDWDSSKGGYSPSIEVTKSTINITTNFKVDESYNKNIYSNTLYMSSYELNNTNLSSYQLKQLINLYEGNILIQNPIWVNQPSINKNTKRINGSFRFEGSNGGTSNIVELNIPIQILDFNYFFKASSSSSTRFNYTNNGSKKYWSQKPETNIEINNDFIKTLNIWLNKKTLLNEITNWTNNSEKKEILRNKVNDGSLNENNKENIKGFLQENNIEEIQSIETPKYYKSITKANNWDSSINYENYLQVLKNSYLSFNSSFNENITWSIEDILKKSFEINDQVIENSKQGKIDWNIKLNHFSLVNNEQTIFIKNNSGYKLAIDEGNLESQYGLSLKLIDNQTALNHQYYYQAKSLDVSRDVSFIMSDGTILDKDYKVLSSSALKVGTYAYKQIRYEFNSNSNKEYLLIHKDNQGDWFSDKFNKKLKMLDPYFNEEKIQYVFDKETNLIINPYSNTVSSHVDPQEALKKGITATPISWKYNGTYIGSRLPNLPSGIKGSPSSYLVSGVTSDLNSNVSGVNISPYEYKVDQTFTKQEYDLLPTNLKSKFHITKKKWSGIAFGTNPIVPSGVSKIPFEYSFSGQTYNLQAIQGKGMTFNNQQQNINHTFLSSASRESDNWENITGYRYGVGFSGYDYVQTDDGRKSFEYNAQSSLDPTISGWNMYYARLAQYSWASGNSGSTESQAIINFNPSSYNARKITITLKSFIDFNKGSAGGDWSNSNYFEFRSNQIYFNGASNAAISGNAYYIDYWKSRHAKNEIYLIPTFTRDSQTNKITSFSLKIKVKFYTRTDEMGSSFVVFPSSIFLETKKWNITNGKVSTNSAPSLPSGLSSRVSKWSVSGITNNIGASVPSGVTATPFEYQSTQTFTKQEYDSIPNNLKSKFQLSKNKWQGIYRSSSPPQTPNGITSQIHSYYISGVYESKTRPSSISGVSITPNSYELSATSNGKPINIVSLLGKPRYAIKNVIDVQNGQKKILESWDDGYWSHSNDNDQALFDGVFGTDMNGIQDGKGLLSLGEHKILINLFKNNVLQKNKFNIYIDYSPVDVDVESNGQLKKTSIIHENKYYDLYYANEPIHFTITDQDIASAKAYILDSDGKWYELPLNIKSKLKDNVYYQYIDSTIDYAGFAKVEITDRANNKKTIFFKLNKLKDELPHLMFKQDDLFKTSSYQGKKLFILKDISSIALADPLPYDINLNQIVLMKSGDFKRVNKNSLLKPYTINFKSNYQYGKTINQTNNKLNYIGDELKPFLTQLPSLQNWTTANKQINITDNGLYELNFKTKLVENQNQTIYIYLNKNKSIKVPDISNKFSKDKSQSFKLLDKKKVSEQVGKNIEGNLLKEILKWTKTKKIETKNGFFIDYEMLSDSVFKNNKTIWKYVGNKISPKGKILEDYSYIDDQDIDIIDYFKMRNFAFEIKSIKTYYSLPWYSSFSLQSNPYDFSKEGKYILEVTDLYNKKHKKEFLVLNKNKTHQQREATHDIQIYTQDQNESTAFWKGKVIWWLYRYEDANHAIWEKNNFIYEAMKKGLTKEEAEQAYKNIKKDPNWNGDSNHLPGNFTLKELAKQDADELMFKNNFIKRVNGYSPINPKQEDDFIFVAMKKGLTKQEAKKAFKNITKDPQWTGDMNNLPGGYDLKKFVQNNSNELENKYRSQNENNTTKKGLIAGAIALGILGSTLIMFLIWRRIRHRKIR